jgi:hypothetical protein
MSGTNSEKRRIDDTREDLRETGQEVFRMDARKFGPEERDLDDGDYMAQIQEIQEHLNRLRRQSSAADGNEDVLSSRRFVFDCLGFYSFVLRLCTEEKCTFGQVPHGDQSFNHVTTETTHCAYAAYTGAPL